MNKSFLLIEQGHTDVIAVVNHPDDELELLQKVNEAVKEHFCYESAGITRVDDNFGEFFEVIGHTDDGDRELREFSLNLVAVY